MLHEIAKKIIRLRKPSSRKSIESANNDTERVFSAEKNSTKKYKKFIKATNKTVFLKFNFCIINFKNCIEKKSTVIMYVL